MKGSVFAIAWVLIAIAATYDGYFAWQYRAVMEAWELNPLARWAAWIFGVEVVIAFKAAGLVYASGLAAYCYFRQSRLLIPLTLIIGSCYAILSLYYILNHLPHGKFSPNPTTIEVLVNRIR